MKFEYPSLHEILRAKVVDVLSNAIISYMMMVYIRILKYYINSIYLAREGKKGQKRKGQATGIQILGRSI